MIPRRGMDPSRHRATTRLLVHRTAPFKKHSRSSTKNLRCLRPLLAPPATEAPTSLRSPSNKSDRVTVPRRLLCLQTTHRKSKTLPFFNPKLKTSRRKRKRIRQLSRREEVASFQSSPTSSLLIIRAQKRKKSRNRKQSRKTRKLAVYRMR